MRALEKVLRVVFFVAVRAVVFVLLGMNVRRKELLPAKGPAIVVANHNSHLDTMVLMSLFPLGLLPVVRPVAAADYFLRSGLIAWFSTRIIGIIPIVRGGATKGGDPLQPCYEALARGEILIIFPEGSRGEPEHLTEFKKGIAHLAEHYPAVPVTPVFMHGLGKALPKGTALLVPFFCDVFVGEALHFETGRPQFMDTLTERFSALTAEGHFAPWE